MNKRNNKSNRKGREEDNTRFNAEEGNTRENQNRIQPLENENPDRATDVRSSDAAARRNMDLTDSPHDQERLKPERATLDLPDVKDIPGQEFVTAPPAGSLGDTTISSADEEGDTIFDNASADRTGVIRDSDYDVTPEERMTLQRGETYMPTRDEDNLHNATMDNTDFDGTPLNEASFGSEQSGRDLDIPDEVDETRTTAMGQGDEENKYYSLGSADNDSLDAGMDERADFKGLGSELDKDES